MPVDSLSVTITLHERDLLLNETTAIGEDVLSKIRVAEVVGDKIRFSISPDDLSHLLDNMAFEANHAVSTEIELVFERLYHRMEKIDDTWCKKEIEQPLITNPPSKGVVEVHRSEVNEDLVRLKHQELLSFGRRPMQQYFDAPIQALGGLTPKQMQALFRDGWWGKEAIIRLNTELGLDDFAASRFLKNARTFLQVLQDVGSAPLTVKGNLARKFVGEMLERMEMDDDYKKEILEYNKVVNEDDLWPLHILRMVCSMAKLVRKYKKRLVATKLGKSLLAEEKAGQLYARLFDAHFTKFNLAYLDSLPDVHHTVQEFIPYSLYRLAHLDADKEFAISDLPDVLLPPSLVDDLDAINEHVKAEDYIRCRYLLPLEKFGLVIIRRTKESGDFIEKERYVRKTALLDRFIKTPRP